MPQWEFQVGPSIGIAAADQLWAARYILEVHKCAQILKFLELYNLLVVGSKFLLLQLNT